MPAPSKTPVRPGVRNEQNPDSSPVELDTEKDRRCDPLPEYLERLPAEFQKFQAETADNIRQLAAALTQVGHQYQALNEKLDTFINYKAGDNEANLYHGLEPAGIFQAALIGVIFTQANQMRLNVHNALTKNKSILDGYTRDTIALAEHLTKAIIDRTR